MLFQVEVIFGYRPKLDWRNGIENSATATNETFYNAKKRHVTFIPESEKGKYTCSELPTPCIPSYGENSTENNTNLGACWPRRAWSALTGTIPVLQ